MVKKLFLTIFFISSIISTFASNEIESCFTLSSLYNINSGKNEIFLLSSFNKLDYISLASKDVYFRYYKENRELQDYSINLKPIEKTYLIDKNNSTILNLDVSINNKLIFDFGKDVSFLSPVFDFSFNDIEIFISSDNKNYKKVLYNDLNLYSYRFLKLIFFPKNNITNIVKIRNIYFEKVTYQYLVKSVGSGNYSFYSNFTCNQDKNFEKIYLSYLENLYSSGNFSYMNGLKSYNIDFSENPFFYSSNISDIDKDGILDTKDDCKDIYNPNQLDSNGNGIGDLCDDDDFDSIIGNNDNCPYISNFDQKDINSNGIGDVCEFDKDKDGVFDSKDNCISVKNSDQKDNDKDTIGDVCDNCNLFNPSQLDSDSNGIGDVCEKEEKYKIENDIDKDGILDTQDNCKTISNNNQLDIDKDFVGDVCDNCKLIKNSDQKDNDNNGVGDICEDVDKDGFLGYLDNCAYDSNSDQKDSDNNGVGDICDDSDYDNIINSKDNCPYISNFDQKDVDNDKIGDSCDKKDDRFIESNKGFFIGLISIITLIFLFGIYFMFKKLQSKNIS